MLARRLLIASAGGASFAAPTWTRGTVSAGGSPVTILDDASWNGFPGITWLDASRCLLVYRRGTSHLAGGDIYGKIATIIGTAVSWGAAFLIYSNAEDVRLDDAVSVVDGQVLVCARLYNGTVNHSPFLLICDDAPASMTASSTWGAPISIPLSSFTANNLTSGRVHKLSDGSYLVGYYGNATAANFESGVLISAALDDWSGMTKVAIGAVGANNYTEINVEEMPDWSLVAHVRSNGTNDHYRATSADHGATWTALASAFDATGFPMFRRLTSGLQLTVYRQITNEENYWRQSDDDGASWSAETVLDATETDSAYATLLQLDSTHVLCVYAIEDDSSDSTDGNLYSQVFTDSSTLA